MIGGIFNSQLYSEHCGVSDRSVPYHVVNEKGESTLSTITILSMPSPSASRSSSLSSSPPGSEQSPSTSNLPILVPNSVCEQDQYPTPHTFESIVQDYLQRLSIKKRDKALVNQERYAVILQVLKDPRNTSIGTAQFRFWVKKMFQLSTTSILNNVDQRNHLSSTWVVCHHGKPVAIQEQIYDILIQAHREAHHGGRDKTSALVRKHYSWIPKELVSRFVQHCPFCVSRRSRQPGRPSLNQPTMSPPAPISTLTTKKGDLNLIKQETHQVSPAASSLVDDNQNYNLNHSNQDSVSQLDFYNDSLTALPLKSNAMTYSYHQHQRDEPIMAPPTPTDATSITATAAASADSIQWLEPSGVPVYYYAKPSSHDIFSSAAMDLRPHDIPNSMGSCAYSSFFVDQQISDNHHHNNNTTVPPASTVDSIISQCQQVPAPSLSSKTYSSWSIMASRPLSNDAL